MEDRLRHRHQYEAGDEQAYSPVGNDRTSEHDSKHGTLRSKLAGHKPGNGGN